MTTALKVFGRVQRLFGDTASVQVVQQDIIDWMNDAQIDIVSQHPDLLPTSRFADAVGGQSDYFLPDEIIALTNVYYANNTGTYFPLKQINPQDFTEWFGVNQPGTPLYYFKSNASPNKITLMPTPDSDLVNGLKLEYNRYATELTDANEPSDLPRYYDSVFIDYCMMKAYELDENWPAATAKEQKISARIATFGYRDSWVGQDRYPHLSTRPEDM